jgi:hypothetical protein
MASGSSKSADAESVRKIRNPFRHLPSDYPLTHSRLPIVPSPGCAGISFIPQISDNPTAEELSAPQVSEESRHAWRDVMERIFGKDAPSV